MERRLELTKEAWKTCTDKPSVKLMMTLEEAASGEVIVIVGEEDFAPSMMVERLLGRWNVKVLDYESDGYTYKFTLQKA
ncbi:MAG: hypothetical protein ABDH61_06010 [Acidilobaceae archaeon]